ncbi:MAG TPA: tRNA (guanosine(46)-N7)-methyltransferase TrmB [Parachlamydiaceae bacterium]|nr:tRNA (guanosine(46)-N7)-methyltransferase TrmB [Parachlamydiaceae bacterium]
MKPEELKPPFPREDQHIAIHDRVWYIPERTRLPSEFVFPGWNHTDLFGNDQPVVIEYCSGNGAWIASKAAANPNINWVAVEIKFDRVRKVWSKIKNLGLNNLIVIYGEAHVTTERYFQNDSISDVYINFPDPWPKKRHAKNRLIQPEFASQLSRILKEGKSLTFVTDDVPYSEWLIEVMGNHKDFTSKYPDPYFLNAEPNYGTSYFDELWRSKGRSIRYHCFERHKN